MTSIRELVFKNFLITALIYLWDKCGPQTINARPLTRETYLFY